MNNIKKENGIENALGIVAIPIFMLIIPLFIVDYTHNHLMKFYLDVVAYTFLPAFIVLKLIWALVDTYGHIKIVCQIIKWTSIFIISIITTYLALPYYKDIPAAITSNYFYIQGIPEHIDYNFGKVDKVTFLINNIKFKTEIDGFDLSSFGLKKKVFKITYLPNTKFILSIDEIK